MVEYIEATPEEYCAPVNETGMFLVEAGAASDAGIQDWLTITVSVR